MTGNVEAAKNVLESAFNKTKEVLNSAAQNTKGLANVAFENVSKIIPGQNSSSNASQPPDNIANSSENKPAPNSTQ